MSLEEKIREIIGKIVPVPECSDDLGDDDHWNCPVYDYIKYKDTITKAVVDYIKSTVPEEKEHNHETRHPMETQGWNNFRQELLKRWKT